MTMGWRNERLPLGHRWLVCEMTVVSNDYLTYWHRNTAAPVGSVRCETDLLLAIERAFPTSLHASHRYMEPCGILEPVQIT